MGHKCYILILSLSIPMLVNCKKDAPSFESFSIEPSILYVNDEGTQQLDVVVLPETAKKRKVLFFTRLEILRTSTLMVAGEGMPQET